MSAFKKAFTLCLSIGLAAGMGSVFADGDMNGNGGNHVEDCGPSCKPNTCKVTCFSGHLGVDPCRKLLTNFINPVMIDSDTGKCADNDDAHAHTCFSGHVGINPCKQLWVNEICAVASADALCDDDCPSPEDCTDKPAGTVVFSSNVALTKELCVNKIKPSKIIRLEPCGFECVEDPDGCVEICNPKFTGELCVDGNIGAIGNCENKNGLIANFVHPGTLDLTNPNCPKCIPNDCGVTCFQGNAAVAPCKTFRANFIEPVKDNGSDCCDGNPQGITSFSGDVGIDCRRKLLVNEINPVRMVRKPNPDSDCDDCLLVAQEWREGTTCFSGNVGVNPQKKLLVNWIDPVCRGREAACVADCPEELQCDPACKDDRSCNAATCFSGHVGLTPCKELWTNFINPVGMRYRNGHPECFDNSETGTTCFSGDVALDVCKTLAVNRICPTRKSSECCADLLPHHENCNGGESCTCPGYDHYGQPCECPSLCEQDEEGCLELCGKNVMVTGTLLANDICPFDPRTPNKADFGDNAMMNFRSNVTVAKDLEILGDLFVDGALLYNGIKPTRATMSASVDECLATIRALDLLEKLEGGTMHRGISADELNMTDLMTNLVGALQACSIQIDDMRLQLDALQN